MSKQRRAIFCRMESAVKRRQGQSAIEESVTTLKKLEITFVVANPESLTQLQNYAATDIAAIAAAVVSFALVFLPPGFVLGWASNVLGFKRRSVTEKLLMSLVLSIAVVPIFAVLVGRFASVTATLSLLLVVLLSAMVLAREDVFSKRRASWSISRSTWIGLGLMALWSTVAALSLMDLQFGDRLYPSAAIYDHSIRIPLVDSASRSGVPPTNPFFGIGKAPVLRYYYYWYVVCALPERLLGLSARACFQASVLWSGFALSAIIPLFLKHFFGERDALRRKSLVGISLLAVTGLDLIPYGLLYFKSHILMADMEWWTPNQITSWFDSLIWVPHHVAALTACMTGLLVLSALPEESGRRERIWAVLIAGLAFASTAGLSIFVTFVFAIFAVLWTIILLAQRRIWNSATYAVAGGIALLASLPYLSDLRSISSLSDPHSNSRAGIRFAVFAIRDYPGGLEWLKHLGLHGFALDAARLPVLVFVYIIELGVFLWVGTLQFKCEFLGKARLTQQRRAAWLLVASSLLTVSTIQSDPSATGGNDLGFRGALLAQFILLLWAAPLLYNAFTKSESAPRIGRTWKGVLACTLIAGVLGTVCQAVVLRCYALLADSGKIERSEGYLGPSSGLGKHIYRMRDGFTRIDKATTPDSVLQYNPAGINLWLAHLYCTRQVVAGDQACSSIFGGDPNKCSEAMPHLAAVFNLPTEFRQRDIDKFCDAYSINYLVATENDPVWSDPNSWVWNRTAVVTGESLRAIPCGTRMPEKDRR